MKYTELIRQQSEYTYSVNIQFDLDNETKLARFIPNETTIKLLKEYFTDIVRENSNNHARILYGSYGTGKSHFLTVLSQLLTKAFSESAALETFLERIRDLDPSLANDIVSYTHNDARKPFLIVPIVFDFEDFNRCIYFSLKKKLDAVGIQVNYKTFFSQAERLLHQWKNSEDSLRRLEELADSLKIDLNSLEKALDRMDPESEPLFSLLFDKMTYGVKYVYEVSNLADTLSQVSEAINGIYSGIVFVFDEFGRYIEDNIRKIKVKDIQDLAEYCDHGTGRNHVILVSHKEISQYTKRFGQGTATEWKKVEGRYKSDSINNKQDQCLSLVKSVLVKNEDAWEKFKLKHYTELEKMYIEALDFKGFLVNVSSDNNPFEGGFPLHPIALFALDRLSKKVAQNDRTFFTYLACKEDNSLYRFLQKNDVDEFHFVGLSDIFDYFEPSIKAVQSDESFEWYKNFQAAIAKDYCSSFDDTPEVKILKTIATIGLVNDSSALVADKRTIVRTIDCPDELIVNALQALCLKKIIKYSGTYGRYEFFDASIFDVEAIIEDACKSISDEAAVKALNEHFVDFVLYPHEYNRQYKINRMFTPVFTRPEDLHKKNHLTKAGRFYDGVLVMLLGNAEVNTDQIAMTAKGIERCIVWGNNECSELISAVKKYLALLYVETQKTRYLEKDPAFEKELWYHKEETIAAIHTLLDQWKHFDSVEMFIISNGEVIKDIRNISQLAHLASEIMFGAYPYTLLVNNELINKNVISGSISSAKKKAVRAIIQGENALNNYGLQYLSPEYIAVRSVLAKNGFIKTEDCSEVNCLANGETPHSKVRDYLKDVIARAQRSSIDIGEVYSTLKNPPFGLRDGYLSLVLAVLFAPHQKSLIITSHGAEQELSAELYEEMIKRPDDYCFTVAAWDEAQRTFIDQLENTFVRFIEPSQLVKNRLKGIHEAMLSHYKSISKFARTTELYVSDVAKLYRKLLEKNYTSYSRFFFDHAKGLAGDYEASFSAIEHSKEMLEAALGSLINSLAQRICDIMFRSHTEGIAYQIHNAYVDQWENKHKKAFDYYTNAFLDFASTINVKTENDMVVAKLAKILTGIEIGYWSDKHVSDFCDRLTEIMNKLANYSDSEKLQSNETRVTLQLASGAEKTMIFDNAELNGLGLIIKNKLKSTFVNFGQAVTYEEKLHIILSLLDDTLEGK